MPISLKCPPPPGILQLRFVLAPVSLQATSNSKNEFRSNVRAQIMNCEYLFSGEVAIDIQWFLHPKIRYEGVHSPDIDNILKPLIDALSGPEGILINDCQVQAVSCSWLDWMKEEQELVVEVRYSPDDWVRKENLVWVEISDKLCMPLSGNLTNEQMILMLESMQRQFETRDEVMSKTGSWEAGQMFMSVQMPFHRARLVGFHIVDGYQLLNELRGSR